MIFYFNSFNAFSNSDFVIVGPSSSGVISSSLSNSSGSSESVYCCHQSALSASSIRVFSFFASIIVFFILFFPKSFQIKPYNFSVFPRLSRFSISSHYCPSNSSLSFLAYLFIRFQSRLYSLLFLSCLCFLLCSIGVTVFSLIHGYLCCCFNFLDVSFAALVMACFKFSHYWFVPLVSVSV